MTESARTQHEEDQARLAAVKAESKAQWEEVRAMGRAKTRKAVMQAKRDAQIAEAKRRQADAEARLKAVKEN